MFDRFVLGSVIAVLAATLSGLARPAHAVVITGLNGTGLSYSSTTATPDTNWSVVALPASFTSPPQTPSFPAWIFTGGSAPTNVPGGWLGGSTNAGADGSHWIGVRSDNATALLPDALTGDYYSVIFATTFQASEAGTVPFSFDIAVDNRATVFVGGNITGTETDRPTITGGQQIGSLIWNVGATVENPDTTPRAFELLQTASGTATVAAGTNTLYVVVDDYISVPNVNPQPYGFVGLLVANPVPEPSTMVLAAFGLSAMGWFATRRLRHGRRAA